MPNSGSKLLPFFVPAVTPRQDLLRVESVFEAPDPNAEAAPPRLFHKARLLLSIAVYCCLLLSIAIFQQHWGCLSTVAALGLSRPDLRIGCKRFYGHAEQVPHPNRQLGFSAKRSTVMIDQFIQLANF